MLFAELYPLHSLFRLKIHIYADCFHSKTLNAALSIISSIFLKVPFQFAHIFIRNMINDTSESFYIRVCVRHLHIAERNKISLPADTVERIVTGNTLGDVGCDAFVVVVFDDGFFEFVFGIVDKSFT